MRAIMPLLASVFLFFSEGCQKMASGSENVAAPAPKWRTLLKPYISSYNSYYDDYLQAAGSRKGRNTLSAKLVDSFAAPFSNANWNRIRLDTNFDETTGWVDDTTGASDLVKNVYYATLHLFVNLAYNLSFRINPNNMSAVERYLGLDAEIVRLIDVSITELANQQRRKTIRVDKLLRFFYGACDIRTTAGDGAAGAAVRLENVKLLFVAYISSYSDHPFYTQVVEAKGTVLVDNLKRSLRTIDVKTGAAFGVSIPSMKMKILAGSTGNELVDAIQRRPACAREPATVHEYVAAYADESDPYKIRRYHVSVLGALIAHVFGYVYNFFELLFYLRAFEIDDGDRKTIEKFSAFADGYVSVFFDRYFEFYGLISQQLVDAMFRILFFLSPTRRAYAHGRDIGQEEASLLNADVAVKITIHRYYEVCNRSADEQQPFFAEMRLLVNDAIRLMTATFVGYAEGAEENWYAWRKFPDDVNKVDKETLMKHMGETVDHAFEILRIFSWEFEVHNFLLNDEESKGLYTKSVENV